MMKLTLSSWAAVAALATGLFSAPAAFAQGTWDLGGSACNPGSVSTAGAANQAVCTVGSVQATMTAWANTGSGGAFVQQQLGENDPAGFGSIYSANETGTNGHHAFDNKTTGCGSNGGTSNSTCGGSQEFMLISFNAKVNLSAMSIGYFDTDADISIYRWDGNAVTTANGTAGAGWTLVASEDLAANGPNFGVNDSTATRNANTTTNLYSSWWLISTYVGGAGANGLDATKNDAFKIKGFTAGVCAGTVTGGSTNGGNATNNNNGGTCNTGGGGAPEPGSLALAGLALAGVFAARRRPVGPSRSFSAA